MKLSDYLRQIATARARSAAVAATAGSRGHSAAPLTAEQRADRYRRQDRHRPADSQAASPHQAEGACGVSRDVSYVGVDARGVARTGRQSVEKVAEFVEKRYQQRWRELTVTAGGDCVGQIGPHYETGQRTWWAES